tara:strand:- start:278 stop:445 length:168 start_codon:yes stop_codon:yes gene_type:complete
MNSIMELTGLMILINLTIILIGILLHDQAVEFNSLRLLMRNDLKQLKNLEDFNND